MIDFVGFVRIQEHAANYEADGNLGCEA
jgi:hypothetical protein